MGTFLVNKGVVFSYDGGNSRLSPIAAKGLERLPTDLDITLDDMWTNKNEPFSLSEAATRGNLSISQKQLHEAGAEIFVPLWARDKFMGALMLGEKFTDEPYASEDLEMLRAISNQIAITLHNHSLFMDLTDKLSENKRLYEEMRLIYHDTIQAFAAAIDAKDPYTRNHSYRVARYVVAIAEELGWNENDIEGIYIAGLLHDVGKIVISDTVLKKETPLTTEELLEIKKHPDLSYHILSKVKFPWKDIVSYIRHHHERLDGSGYPDHLNNATLSEGAKILTLADSFDAMTTDRPYRKGMTLSASLEELKRCLGFQFDSKIMAAFCRVLEKEIKGQLADPNILPHLDKEFDPSVITLMLETIKGELAE